MADWVGKASKAWCGVDGNIFSLRAELQLLQQQGFGSLAEQGAGFAANKVYK